MIDRRFALFLVASGIAAAANFASRFLFNLFVPYEFAIVMAFMVGMGTAFLLNRTLVFTDSDRSLHQQAAWFLMINLLSLLQTLVISIALSRWIFPATGMSFHPESVAHALGIAAPALVSYLGHKHLTFKKSKETHS